MKNPFRKKTAKPLSASTMSDIKRGEYARDIRRHEQSLAAREKQIADLIADQKDERAVLQSIRTAEACLNGPIFDAKVEKILSEELAIPDISPAIEEFPSNPLEEIKEAAE